MADKAKLFEQKIKDANPEPPKITKPTKQRSWTPNAVEQHGSLDTGHYNKQTAAKKGYAEGQLPPKKSISDLP
jgi:collagenase-like PrtC family protease